MSTVPDRECFYQVDTPCTEQITARLRLPEGGPTGVYICWKHVNTVKQIFKEAGYTDAYVTHVGRENPGGVPVAYSSPQQAAAALATYLQGLPPPCDYCTHKLGRYLVQAYESRTPECVPLESRSCPDCIDEVTRQFQGYGYTIVASTPEGPANKAWSI